MLFFFFYDNSKQAAATVEIIITKGLNSELIKRPRVSINMCFHAYYKTILEREITISADTLTFQLGKSKENELLKMQ